MGKKYEECSFVVCHIGGGISVSAHCAGKMIDGYDIVGGEGLMAPTRCGSIAVTDLLKYAEGKDIKELKALCTKTGGFVSHLGLSDAIELTAAGLDIIFLQFDGTTDKIYEELRGRALLDTKLEAIRVCSELKTGVTLVPAGGKPVG